MKKYTRRWIKLKAIIAYINKKEVQSKGKKKTTFGGKKNHVPPYSCPICVKTLLSFWFFSYLPSNLSQNPQFGNKTLEIFFILLFSFLSFSLTQ